MRIGNYQDFRTRKTKKKQHSLAKFKCAYQQHVQSRELLCRVLCSQSREKLFACLLYDQLHLTNNYKKENGNDYEKTECQARLTQYRNKQAKSCKAVQRVHLYLTFFALIGLHLNPSTSVQFITDTFQKINK